MVMRRFKAVLQKYGIQLKLLNLDSEGYYDSTLKIMFVNEKLSEFEMKKAIYHELGHGVLHDELTALYKMPVPRSKMEHEADFFMIEALLKDYLSVNTIPPEEINPVQFIESNGLDPKYEFTVKEILQEYVLNTGCG